MHGIDLKKVGVDKNGKSKTGGKYYKFYTLPEFVCEPQYRGDWSLRFVLNGIEKRRTHLTNMFMDIKHEKNKSELKIRFFLFSAGMFLSWLIYFMLS